MKGLQSIGLVWILILVWLSPGQLLGNEVAGPLRMYRCVPKSISVTNVEIFKQDLYDAEGNPVTNVNSGYAPMFVGGEEIQLKGEAARKMTDSLGLMKNWKTTANQVDAPVGMIDGLTEVLIFLGDRWWILAVYSGKVSVRKIDVVLETKNVRLAVITPGEGAMTSDDGKVVELFEDALVEKGP